MTVVFRMVLLFLFIHAALAQTGKKDTITIREPGTYQLGQLFNDADKVVLAKVVAGDTESYDVAIYKADVVKNFKGGAAGETLFYGPFLGERLGVEYILFLRDVPKPITPKQTSTPGYGTIRYSQVFNEGLTSLETSYECVFDGKDIAQQCDYAVRVCTDHIKLPKLTPAFPKENKNTLSDCRWVRKDVFVSLLDALAHTNN